MTLPTPRARRRLDCPATEGHVRVRSARGFTFETLVTRRRPVEPVNSDTNR